MNKILLFLNILFHFEICHIKKKKQWITNCYILFKFTIKQFNSKNRYVKFSASIFKFIITDEALRTCCLSFPLQNTTMRTVDCPGLCRWPLASISQTKDPKCAPSSPTSLKTTARCWALKKETSLHCWFLMRGTAGCMENCRKPDSECSWSHL